MQAADIHRLQTEHGLSDASIRELSDYREPITEQQFKNGVHTIIKKAANGEMSKEECDSRIHDLFLGAKAAGKYGSGKKIRQPGKSGMVILGGGQDEND